MIKDFSDLFRREKQEKFGRDVIMYDNVEDSNMPSIAYRLLWLWFIKLCIATHSVSYSQIIILYNLTCFYMWYSFALYIDAVDLSSIPICEEENCPIDKSNRDECGTACFSTEELVLNCLENQEDYNIPLNTGKLTNSSSYSI